jgi:hypothetical protein
MLMMMTEPVSHLGSLSHGRLGYLLAIGHVGLRGYLAPCVNMTLIALGITTFLAVLITESSTISYYVI